MKYPPLQLVDLKKLSKGEETLAFQMKAHGIQAEREYRFAPPRRWRFDFAIPDRKVALEVEGGIHTQGRHSRGKGFEADCEKYNRAATVGWMVLRYSTGMVQRGEAINDLCRLLDITA